MLNEISADIGKTDPKLIAKFIPTIEISTNYDTTIEIYIEKKQISEAKTYFQSLTSVLDCIYFRTSELKSARRCQKKNFIYITKT